MERDMSNRIGILDRARRLLARFRRDERGIAAVEFGMIASVLTVTMLGGIELSRYALMHQKLDRVSSSVAQMTSQSGSVLAQQDLDNMYAGARHIAAPYSLAERGIVHISFLLAEQDNQVRIVWQRCGAGTLQRKSRLGDEGELAVMPEGIVMRQGMVAVAVEVYARYDAMVFPDVVGGNNPIVYKFTYDRPRLVDMITAEGTRCNVANSAPDTL
jgi:Flp pilus assembly pilin Flp